MSKTNFSGYPEFVATLERLGFKPFGPGHSARNGYEIVVNDQGRRACFYDNRLWNQPRIEFTIMDYGKKPVIKKLIFGLYSVKYETRFGIFTSKFENADDLTDDMIEVLVTIAKSIE